MSRIASITGYTLAVMATPVVLATFIGMPFWAGQLVAVTGLKVSPWYSGGEVAQTIDHGQYHCLIHRPIFDGLICERSKGFVQVNWTPLESLPGKIAEDISLDGGDPDFHIELDTSAGAAKLDALNPRVLGLEGTYKLKKSWAVRVLLSNTK
jgi:hypothetical protein